MWGTLSIFSSTFFTFNSDVVFCKISIVIYDIITCETLNEYFDVQLDVANGHSSWVSIRS